MEIVLFIMMLIVPVFAVFSFILSLLTKKRVDALKTIVVKQNEIKMPQMPVQAQIEMMEI